MEIKQTPEQTPKDHIEALVSAVYSGYTGLADFDVAKTVVSELLSLREYETSLRQEVERLKADNKIMRSGFDALHGENEGLRKEGLEFPSESGEQINWFLVNAMRILNSEQRLSLADNILERSEVETRDKLQEKFNELNTRHQNVRDVVRISKKEKDALQSLNTELVSALRLLHSMRFDQPYYTKEQSDTFRRVTAALSRAEGKTT